MTGYLYFYQQIASRSAIGSRFSFFTDTDALSIVDTCRNRYLDLLSACGKSGSTAIRAFVFDDLTGSSTVRTGLYVSYHTEHGLLCICYLTGSMTFATGFRRSTRFCTGSVTFGTGIFQCQFQFFFAAENCFLESNVNNRTQVCSTHRTVVRSAASSATEQIPENIAEDIAHICAVKVESTETATLTGSTIFKCCMTVLVVCSSLFRIAQYAVRLCRLFKFCFCFFIPWVHIRMILFRQFPVCFFQGRIISSALYTQNLIIISFLCHFLSPYRNASYPWGIQLRNYQTK